MGVSHCRLMALRDISLPRSMAPLVHPQRFDAVGQAIDRDVGRTRSAGYAAPTTVTVPVSSSAARWPRATGGRLSLQ
jgi:hypothetical protein